jgi:IclR family acetate operon transcriptional repressor
MEQGIVTSSREIESVAKALRLLTAFRDRTSMRVTEAAQILNVAPSTAHRLLATLVSQGFVARDTATRAYIPGPRLIDIGLAVVRDMDPRRVLQPCVERLRDVTGETVHVGILRGQEVVFVDSVESREPLRAGSVVGQTLFAHCTASGKALLAELSLGELAALYPGGELPPAPSASSVTTLTDLMDDLLRTKARGHAASHGETRSELCAVAAPVRARSGKAVASITVTVPTSRFSNERELVLAAHVVAAANQAGRLLA